MVKACIINGNYYKEKSLTRNLMRKKKQTAYYTHDTTALSEINF